jgi:hypothetical protein
VPEAPRELESGAVASGFRQRLATGRKDQESTLDAARCRRELKTTARPFDVENPASPKQLDAGPVGASNQRVEDVAGVPTDWK